MKLIQASRQCLNPMSGLWEPILERFRLSLEVERKAVENDRDTHVVLNGREPVLLNVTPSVIKRLRYITPQFLESLTSANLVGDDHGHSAEKYRVLNLRQGQ